MVQWLRKHRKLLANNAMPRVGVVACMPPRSCHTPLLPIACECGSSSRYRLHRNLFDQAQRNTHLPGPPIDLTRAMLDAGIMTTSNLGYMFAAVALLGNACSLTSRYDGRHTYARASTLR